MLIDENGRILVRHVSQRTQDRWAPQCILDAVRDAIQ